MRRPVQNREAVSSYPPVYYLQITGGIMAASIKAIDNYRTSESKAIFVADGRNLSESGDWDSRPAAHSTDQVSQLLLDWGDGNQAALDNLITIVYDELRRLAHHFMIRERLGHTLQTTALVDEAYLRLVDQKHTQWKNRAQFFAIAAQLMRRILVDHARSHGRAKRGGGAHHVALDDVAVLSPERGADLIALDFALERLAAIDRRKSRIVEMRYFGGLSVEETADVLGISPITVKRDWLVAKAWLRREISNEATAMESNQ
jgi:RNA polymerase sigma factor (TIGR02999 family)